MKSILKNPSAWIPIVLTVGILCILCLSFIGVIPPDPAGDEGTSAHLFQIWLVLEALTIGFFALNSISKKPKEALLVLGIQIVLALIPILIVFSLHL